MPLNIQIFTFHSSFLDTPSHLLSNLLYLCTLVPILSDIHLDACAFGDKTNAFNTYNREIGHENLADEALKAMREGTAAGRMTAAEQQLSSKESIQFIVNGPVSQPLF